MPIIADRVRLGALRGATVVGPDLDAWTAAYRTYLGYRGGPPGSVGDACAHLWGCPAAAGCRTVTLTPASGAATFIRFVESAVTPAIVPLASTGWNAAEIVVADLDRVAEALADSPFRVLGPPAILDFDFTDQIRAMQVAGPAGEVLYLTEIAGEIPGFTLPVAQSPIDRMFVAVLGTTDLDAAAAWYGAAVGADLSPPIEARVPPIAAALSLDDGTRFRLVTAALPDATLVEIDALPASTVSRTIAECGLPGGIAIMTFDAAGIESDQVRRGTSGELLELVRVTA